MRLWKILAIVAALVMILMSAISSGTTAKPEYTKKEKKACTYCHASKNPKEYSDKDLTDAGKYYKEKKTLEGYKEKPKGN